MKIIHRHEWGARHGQGSALSETPSLVVIHHTAGAQVARDVPEETEASVVREIERFHAVERGWAGIGYSWLVFPSGRVYEGRGWMRAGAHTKGKNSTSVGVAFAGDFRRESPTVEAVDAVRELLQVGVDGRVLTREFQVRGHRDYAETECPGDRLYRVLPDLARPLPPTPSDLPAPRPLAPTGRPLPASLGERVRAWVRGMVD